MRRQKFRVSGIVHQSRCVGATQSCTISPDCNNQTEWDLSHSGALCGFTTPRSPTRMVHSYYPMCVHVHVHAHTVGYTSHGTRWMESYKREHAIHKLE